MYRSSLEDKYVYLILGWTVIGALGGLLFGYPAIPFQRTHGIYLEDTQYLIVNWTTAGAIAGILIGAYDARKRTYRDELAAHRDELLTQKEELERFAGILSHDLRNPLNVAAGRTELAHDSGDVEHLEKAKQAHDRAFEIIEDTLTLTRHSNTVPEEDVEAVELAQFARSGWNNIDTDGAELAVVENLQFQADASRMRHIFENLFRNAVEHGGSDVTIRVGSKDANSGIFIEDNGPGIDEKDRSKIFEPGFTHESDGTGLGMAIVESMASAHGWSVSVTSSDSGGARFEIDDVDVVDQLTRNPEDSG